MAPLKVFLPSSIMELFLTSRKTNQKSDYYCLIISNKAQLLNNAHKLKHEFKLSEDDLELIYTLGHKCEKHNIKITETIKLNYFSIQLFLNS